MKKVVTFGVFDYFHIGHLNLFEKAKEYGDYLIVAVQDDEKILEYKPDAGIYYSTEQRVRLVNAIGIVDEVLVYRDVDTDIRNIDFDVFAVGEEQNHDGFIRAVNWCKENNKEVVVLPRTKGISSTQIKEKVESLS